MKQKLVINVIGSGSKGNCIELWDGQSLLYLDAGIPWSTMRKYINGYNIGAVEGFLITHEHMDHCRAIKSLLYRGIRMVMSKGTAHAVARRNKNMPFYAYLRVKHRKEISLPSWRVIGFKVMHDARDPFGFLIESKVTGDKIVYAVDTPSIQFTFDGITHWILGANFSEKIIRNSNYNTALVYRIMRNHMCFEALVAFLAHQDLSTAKQILLTHLSDTNSDEKTFIQALQEETGVPVYTA